MHLARADQGSARGSTEVRRPASWVQPGSWERLERQVVDSPSILSWPQGRTQAKRRSGQAFALRMVGALVTHRSIGVSCGEPITLEERPPRMVMPMKKLLDGFAAEDGSESTDTEVN